VQDLSEIDDGRLDVRIRTSLSRLTASERQVAEYLLAVGASAAGLTIGELATATGTSVGTVTRFAKALGLPGYPQLRLALAAETGRDTDPRLPAGFDRTGGTIAPGADLAAIVTAITGADVRAITDTAAQLDLAVLARCAELLAVAPRIDLYAVGGSAHSAAEFQLRLHSIGRPCWVWPDTHSALSSAALLGSGDVAVGVSHSGRTEETVEALTVARASGATAVALTNFPRSPLAEAADLVLTTALHDTTFRPRGTACVHAQLTVLDCLYAAVAQRDRAAVEAAHALTAKAVEGHRRHRPT
jgi:DNA-binding MurR/RpiR family transcriptional regulator